MSAARSVPLLQELVAARLRGRVVLVGIGNPLLGDDAAGCLVARGLANLPGIEVVESDDVPERDALRVADMAPDVVVLVDAVQMGAPPGSVAVLDPDALAGYTPTTHRVPLSLIAAFIHQASAADVFVLAIQPGRVAFGAGVSPEVARSVGTLVEMVRRSSAGTARAQEAWAC